MTTLYYIGFSEWFREYQENLLFVSVSEVKETDKTFRAIDKWETNYPTFKLNTTNFFSEKNSLDFLTRTREPYSKIIRKSSMEEVITDEKKFKFEKNHLGVISTDFEGICAYFEKLYSGVEQTNNNEPYRLAQIKKIRKNKEDM